MYGILKVNIREIYTAIYTVGIKRSMASASSSNEAKRRSTSSMECSVRRIFVASNIHLARSRTTCSIAILSYMLYISSILKLYILYKSSIIVLLYLLYKPFIIDIARSTWRFCNSS